MCGQGLGTPKVGAWELRGCEENRKLKLDGTGGGGRREQGLELSIGLELSMFGTLYLSIQNQPEELSVDFLRDFEMQTPKSHLFWLFRLYVVERFEFWREIWAPVTVSKKRISSLLNAVLNEMTGRKLTQAIDSFKKKTHAKVRQNASDMLDWLLNMA